MLFRSSIDPNTWSTQQFMIFCHAQDRVLLPLPNTYEDAQVLARKEFSLSGELIFETDDLHGSEGVYVRIHRAAWEGISPVLRSVTVKTASSPSPSNRARPSEALSSGSRRLSSQKRMSIVGSAPIRLSGGLAPALPVVERQSISARKSPFPSHSPKVSAVSSGSHKEAGPSSFKGSPPTPQPAAPAPAKIEELEDEEEEVRLPSPSKKRSTRPRIMSDYGLDNADAEEEEEEESARGSRKVDDPSEEEFDQLDDAEFASAGPSTSQLVPQVPTSAKPTLSRSSDDASLVELDGTSSGSAARKTGRSSPVRHLDAPASEPPKAKTEKAQQKAVQEAPQSQAPSSSSRSQPQPKADESFLIMIEYSDDPDSRTLFKTRARHAVSKVLMQACRTFGLEEYYRSARLILLIEEEDDEVEIAFQRRYVCDRNETMGEAGAEPNSKFVVELVYEGDDDE